MRFQNILLIRVGSTIKKKAGHPVHHPAPLTLKYAQTILEKDGFSARILDFWVDPMSIEDLLNRIDEWDIDTVVLDISSPAAEPGVRLCADLREHRDLFLIITGSDVSERLPFYQELRPIHDVVLRGEYEVELSRLLTTLRDSKDIHNVLEYYKEIKSKELLLVEDLDVLPALSWDRAEIKKHPYIYPLKLRKRITSGYVSTSRGCPHGCTFCSPTVRKSYGRTLRRRSAEKVAEDIERLIRVGVNFISFEDDDFTLNKEHVRAICSEIIRRKLKIHWACHARVDEASPDLLAVMKKSGCTMLLCGIESGSQNIVNTLHKAAARQGWRQRAVLALNQARKAGIATCAMFIVGSPTETLDDIRQSIDLAFEMRPDFIKVHFFTLYPGSVDYRNHKKSTPQGETQHHYMNPSVNLSNMPMPLLKQAQRRFYRKFLLRPSFLLGHVRDYLPFYIVNMPDSIHFIRDGLLFLLTPLKNYPQIAAHQTVNRQSSVH